MPNEDNNITSDLRRVNSKSLDKYPINENKSIKSESNVYDNKLDDIHILHTSDFDNLISTNLERGKMQMKIFNNKLSLFGYNYNTEENRSNKSSNDGDLSMFEDEISNDEKCIEEFIEISDDSQFYLQEDPVTINNSEISDTDNEIFVKLNRLKLLIKSAPTMKFNLINLCRYIKNKN
jgi:hypothetical protein